MADALDKILEGMEHTATALKHTNESVEALHKSNQMLSSTVHSLMKRVKRLEDALLNIPPEEGKDESGKDVP